MDWGLMDPNHGFLRAKLMFKHLVRSNFDHPRIFDRMTGSIPEWGEVNAWRKKVIAIYKEVYIPSSSCGKDKEWYPADKSLYNG